MRVGGFLASPAIACGTVTEIRIVAGAGGQLADLSGADAAAFTALVHTKATLGEDDDRVIMTANRANQVSTGLGSDTVTAPISTSGLGPDTVDMGPSGGYDRLVVQGRAVADDVTVLDFGRVIAQGPPAQVRQDPAVLTAYVGEVRTDELVKGSC